MRTWTWIADGRLSSCLAPGRVVAGFRRIDLKTLARPALGAMLIGSVVLAGCGGKGSAEAAAAAGTPSPEIVISGDRITLPPGSPKLNLIHVAPVAMGQFQLEEVSAPGEIEANPNRVSHVLMPVMGRIRQVLVHLGDTVSEGQPLVVIESPDATAALATQMQAESQIRQAKSALLKSQRDLARARDLHEHGALALKDLQSAENDEVQAQGNVEQAQASADANAQRLKTLGLEPGQLSPLATARAPIAGKVMDIAVAPGEYRNDTSASLMTINDLQTVWMSALVPETKIRYVQVGEAVRAELSAYPGEVYQARVIRISDTVDPQTRTIRVEAEIPNPSFHLRVGMFGQMHHMHPPVEKPAVPVAAVVETSGRSVVYVEENPGTFRERQITTGDRQNDLLPVLSGLSPGERIIVDGVMLLRTEEAVAR